MGGSITVESVVGDGSCFRVIVPFEVSDFPTTTETGPEPTKPVCEFAQIRVLYVDDDQHNQLFMVALLRRLGAVVSTASNGLEGLKLLAKEPYDLVLMDIQMPVMNGEEALSSIRRHEEMSSRHQKVIALSALSMSGDRERFLSLGFDGYVSKPVFTEALCSEIKLCLA